MNSHITRDIKGCSASSIQIIFKIYKALLFRYKGLPKNFDDIPNVNIYEAPGEKGGDWKQYLEDKGQAWIITPLHYSSGTGSTNIRIASGGGSWNGRTGRQPLKNNLDAYCEQRKYRLKTKEGTGLRTYMMIEYSPAQDKPTHALCQITFTNKNIASSQKREGKEIDHTDSNNGDKRKTSQSQEFVQQGGNFQNTTADYNQQILEKKLRELIKHHSFADIRKVLDQIESEKLPAASPKEQSTEAPVSNTTHGRRCTCTNTMEAGTSTKWQEQAKVEMFESNTYRLKPTNLSCDTNRNYLEKNDEQDRNTIYLEQLLSSCNTDELDDLPLGSQLRYQQLLAELTACVQEPNQLSHNFNANSTVAMDYQTRIELYPSTSATTEDRLDHQMFESDADVLEPNNSSYNFKTISTEPTEKGNHLPIYNQNTIAHGLDKNNNATTEPEDMDWMSYLDLSD